MDRFKALTVFKAVAANGGFTQTFGASEVSQTNPNLGMHVQDEWKLTPRITLNVGARYDLQFLETIDTDTNNISPRLGVAWSPFDSRRTLVRASAVDSISPSVTFGLCKNRASRISPARSPPSCRTLTPLPPCATRRAHKKAPLFRAARPRTTQA